jgi:hypothetical protein
MESRLSEILWILLKMTISNSITTAEDRFINITEIDRQSMVLWKMDKWVVSAVGVLSVGLERKQQMDGLPSNVTTLARTGRVHGR